MKKETRTGLMDGTPYAVYVDPVASRDVYASLTGGEVVLSLTVSDCIRMTADEARLVALALIRAADESERDD